MSKPIAPSQHLMTDYMFGPAIAAAPGLFGFRDEPIANLLCRVIGGGILAATSLTNAKGALLPIVPMTAHLAGDVANGVFVLSAPWLFGFSENTRARNTFLAIGAVSLLAGSLTRTEE